MPTPTEQVWVNTDAMRLTDGVTTFTLKQGEAATFSVTYDVTTPRTSTTIYAELVGQVDGWTITSADLADTDPGATTAAWTQTATTEPGSSFTTMVAVTAPKTVTADHSVTLRLWSTAEGTKGQETGVAKADHDDATFAVIAPAPTPTPTVAAKPTQQSATTLTRTSLTANVTPPPNMPNPGTCGQPSKVGDGVYKIICALPEGEKTPVKMTSSGCRGR